MEGLALGYLEEGSHLLVQLRFLALRKMISEAIEDHQQKHFNFLQHAHTDRSDHDLSADARGIKELGVCYGGV